MNGLFGILQQYVFDTHSYLKHLHDQGVEVIPDEHKDWFYSACRNILNFQGFSV